ERQTLLFHVAQVLIPAARLIEHRHESIKNEPLEHLRERSWLEARDGRRVGENFAQSARRQARNPRQIEHRFALRTGDAPGAPWPQARQSSKEQGFWGPRFTCDEHALGAPHLDVRFLKLRAAGL